MNREFIETNAFMKRWQDLGLDDNELKNMQEYMTENPDAGNIIAGTGGLRKLRWKISNKGKSGGIRIIYIGFTSYKKIYLLGVYSKNMKEALSESEKTQLREVVKTLLFELRGE